MGKCNFTNIREKLIKIFIFITVIGAIMYGSWQFVIITHNIKVYDDFVDETIDTIYNEGVFSNAEKKEEWRNQALKSDYRNGFSFNPNESFTLDREAFSELIKDANPHASLNLSSDILSSKDMPVEVIKHEGYIYIKIPSIQLLDGSDKTKQLSVFSEYVSTIDNALSSEIPLNNVILDFQRNSGGISEAMILGVSSLLCDNFPLYTLILPDGTEEQTRLIRKSNGDTFEVQINEKTRFSNEDLNSFNNLHLIDERLNVAVLMDNCTASAAEFTILALINSAIDNEKLNLKTFGKETKGLTSATIGVAASDGSAFANIPGAWTKDNQGKIYRNDPILPDIKTKEGEETIELAVSWLLEN